MRVIHPVWREARRRFSYFDDNNGKCMKLQIEMDGEKRILFTGSQVLQDLTQKYAGMIPFETTIIRQNRYITFS